MYIDYFGLKTAPFTISPDPAFLYPSPQHRQALAHLKYGLEREGGFILLSGEVGTGKTTLTRLLLEQLPGNIRVAYILNAKLNSQDVLANICQELQLEYSATASVKQLIDVINPDLLAAHSQGKKTLLVIEEAQNLDPEVLEMLRLLTNLETNTTKLLHILLVGQPELLELIARNDLRQLNQRVVSRFHIEPLNLSQTDNYLNHRMRKAGCQQSVFDRSAVRLLQKLSGGIPRVLNLLAERSLLGAYATNVRRVSSSIVKHASEEVLGLSAKSSEAAVSGKWISIVVLIALAALGWRYEYVQSGQDTLAAGQTSQQSPQLDNQQDIEASSVMTTEPLGQRLDLPASAALTSNAFGQLLAAWGVQAEADNQTQLCRVALQHNLLCETGNELSIQDLNEINRPGVVTVSSGQDSLSFYLLVSLDENRVKLSNASGLKTLLLVDFATDWSGGLTYLWSPPTGYREALYPGARNPVLVSWVQDQLGQIFDDYEYIISGGVYTEHMARFVARFQSRQGLDSDGLLGPRTILSLMEQNQILPTIVLPSAEDR